MKVIDLLNKIASREEVPKKIKYKGHIYQYQYKDTKEANIINYYHSEETHHHLIDGGWHDIRLNDEVEIIEDKKIEYEDIEEFGTIKYDLGYVDYKNPEILKDWLSYDFQTIYDTLDLLIRNQKKLIEEVNKLKEKE